MKIKRFNDINESKKSIPEDILNLMKRVTNGEKLPKDDDWNLHVWLYDNDSIYKKQWEDSIYRHQMSLEPKDRLKDKK